MRLRSAQFKIRSTSVLKKILNREKKKGKRIVFTNGCFDILHLGHVRYLGRAREQGDMLVVGLNTDASVKKLKGEGRPFNNERDRAEVLASLECVDYVMLFKENTPLKVIKILKPDVLVKGGDYEIKEIVGHESVLAGGGRVMTIPLVPGRSTSALIKMIQSKKSISC